MIIIDGGIGSGGGQVLRTAIGLSALTGKPCRIQNIRAKRPKPGLREQHLQSIRAVKKLCDGKLIGDQIGSSEVEFYPEEVKPCSISIEISTAGSVGLVLQALLIPALKVDLSITISGGATFGKWAPPVSFLQNVLIPILLRAGYHVQVEILREGFYPKGGAEIKVKTKKATLRPIEIISKGEIVRICSISVASTKLKGARVAERQSKAAMEIINKHRSKFKPQIDVKYDETTCPGSGIQLWFETKKSLIGGSGLGEKGKRAEIVGREAAEMLIHEYEEGVVDSFASDQLLPYMAIGGGVIKTSRITNHIKTNIAVIESFLQVRFEVEDRTIKCLRCN